MFNRIKILLPPSEFFGWVSVVALSVIPCAAWLIATKGQGNFSDAYSSVSTLGKLAGVAGLVLYSSSFVLSARLRTMEKLFGGLNKVYIAHHITGGMALIFLTLHPTLLLARYLTDDVSQALKLIFPSDLGPHSALVDAAHPLHAVVLRSWAVVSGQVAFVGLVVLLILTLFVKLPYKLWLFTHKFLGAAFFFGGLHAILIKGSMSQVVFVRIFIMVATVIGLVAFSYRTLLGNIVIRRYKMKLLKVEQPSESIVVLHLSKKLSGFSYKPGQFVYLRFLDPKKNIGNEWHPFSISSSPADDTLTFHIKALGDYTSSLGSLQPGVIAEIEGAYGSFGQARAKQTARPRIWIGGGIGVTPFLGMATSLDESSPPTWLIHSVRSAEEFIAQSSLKKVTKDNENFFYTGFDFSENGYISLNALSGLAVTAAPAFQAIAITECDIFLCGPPTMMHALSEQALKLGVPRSHIHSEEFSMR
jgi:predicted ferric reductase